MSLRDSSLFSFERQVKLPQPTMQEKDIAEAAYQLYKKNYRWSEHLRSVGVRAIDLRPDTEPNQISFEYSAEKQEETERLESAIDGIRNRFGYYSVQRAVMYKDRFLSHCDAKGDHTIHPHGYGTQARNLTSPASQKYCRVNTQRPAALGCAIPAR